MKNLICSCLRSSEDIQKILKLAKLNENDVLPTTQTIYFASDDISNNNHKFLELDRTLTNTLKEGQVLRLIGDDNKSTVLCSTNHTYNLIEAETSNSLLLVKPFKYYGDITDQKQNCISKVLVQKIFYSYLEAVPSQPKFKKLRNILMQTAYKGPEHEYQLNQNDLVTKEDLLNQIQSSEEELLNELTSMNAITINGKVRLLDFEYHFRVLSYMLKVADGNSWPLDEIDMDETLKELDELFPKEVVTCLFRLYCVESKIIDGEQLYKYKEHDVCKFFAQVLLHSAGKFNLDDFFQAWKESVPEGMITDESMLAGIAIIDREANPNVIRAFYEDSLPEEITERFKVLFEIKEKWTVSEIAAYIK